MDDVSLGTEGHAKFVLTMFSATLQRRPVDTRSTRLSTSQPAYSSALNDSNNVCRLT